MAKPGLVFDKKLDGISWPSWHIVLTITSPMMSKDKKMKLRRLCMAGEAV